MVVVVNGASSVMEVRSRPAILKPFKADLDCLGWRAGRESEEHICSWFQLRNICLEA